MPPSFLQDMTKEDFALPSLGSKLVALRDQVVHGTGFVLLRGLPVGQWSQDEIAAAYWGIGRHWGNPQSQNRLHHLLGHVKVRQSPPFQMMYSYTIACVFCKCTAVQLCVSCGTCTAGLLAPEDILVACCTPAEFWPLGLLTSCLPYLIICLLADMQCLLACAGHQAPWRFQESCQ